MRMPANTYILLEWDRNSVSILLGWLQDHTRSQLRKGTLPLPTPRDPESSRVHRLQLGLGSQGSKRALEGRVFWEAGNTRFQWGRHSCTLCGPTAPRELWRKKGASLKLQWLIAIPLLILSKYSLLYLILYSKCYILFLKEKPKWHRCGAPQNPNLSLHHTPLGGIALTRSTRSRRPWGQIRRALICTH